MMVNRFILNTFVIGVKCGGVLGFDPYLPISVMACPHSPSIASDLWSSLVGGRVGFVVDHRSRD